MPRPDEPETSVLQSLRFTVGLYMVWPAMLQASCAKRLKESLSIRESGSFMPCAIRQRRPVLRPRAGVRATGRGVSAGRPGARDAGRRPGGCGLMRRWCLRLEGPGCTGPDAAQSGA